MSRVALSARLFTASVAISMLSSPTFAAISATPSTAIDPMVALSLLGSAASRDALCGVTVAGAAGAAAAASATAAQSAPAQGCVLPVVDTPPVIVEPTSAPVAVVPTSAGLSLGLPILLAVAGAAVIAALTLLGSNDEDRSPLSPA